MVSFINSIACVECTPTRIASLLRSQGFVNTTVYGINRLIRKHFLQLLEGCGCIGVVSTASRSASTSAYFSAFGDRSFASEVRGITGWSTGQQQMGYRSTEQSPVTPLIARGTDRSGDIGTFAAVPVKTTSGAHSGKRGFTSPRQILRAAK